MKIKRDIYRKSRGGNSQVYQIFCSQCEKYLLTYQKDGTGTLLRLYYDRIIMPPKNTPSNLICENCSNLIGISMIYKPEERPAFRLVRGAFRKKRNLSKLQ